MIVLCLALPLLCDELFPKDLHDTCFTYHHPSYRKVQFMAVWIVLNDCLWLPMVVWGHHGQLWSTCNPRGAECTVSLLTIQSLWIGFFTSVPCLV